MGWLPEPLHPALVHFPIVLALLAPLVAIGALVARDKWQDSWQGSWPLWAFVVIFQGLLCLSVYIASETGEEERSVVEASVAAAPLDAHEEAAEVLLGVASAVLVVAALGLIRGRAQRLVQGAVIVGCIVVAVLAARVGALGGDLVYRHGAASHYNK